MPINFSNVNISLQQFQDISHGKYNAGEVKLASETTLEKVNNHVHKRGENATPISHAEVLAVKQAFVKALSQGGVAADEINRVRTQLGLAPETQVDTNLKARSIKPLSRQQVREILDRNAAAINAHEGEGTIRTSEELYAGVSERKRASRAATRETVNAGIGAQRDISENKKISIFQAIVSGDVDYATTETRKEYLQAAKELLDAILVKCGGQPREDHPCVVSRTNSRIGKVSMDTGMTEAQFVRKLEDMIVRLQSSDAMPTTDERDVRSEFNALATDEERIAFVTDLANDPYGAVKARALAVAILYDRGVTDYETLSIVNTLKDGDAIGFAANLVSSSLGLRGDALRNSAAVATARACADPNLRLGQLSRAVIPALTPEQFNKEIMSSLVRHPERMLPGFRMLAQNVSFEIRSRFGEKGVPDNTQLEELALEGDVDDVFHDCGPARATPELIREGFTAAAVKKAARRFAITSIKERIEGYGGKKGDANFVGATFLVRHPQFYEQLQAAQSPEEAEAVVARFEKEIEEAVRRHTLVTAAEENAPGIARELIARDLGIPAGHLAVRGAIDLKGLTDKVKALREDICRGKHPANTPEEIDKACRDIVDKYVAERTAALATVDTLDLSDAAKDEMKKSLLRMNKIGYLNLPSMTAAAKQVGTFSLEVHMEARAPKETIYQSLREINLGINAIIDNLFAPMRQAGKEIGPDELGNAREILLTAWFDAHPGIEKTIKEFINRPDVQNDRINDRNNIAYNVQNFIEYLSFKDANETLVAALGKPDLPPLHAQALVQAVRDEGLEDFTAQEALALFAPGGAAHGVLKTTMEFTTGEIPPSTLKIMARGALRTCKAAVQQARQDARAFAAHERAFLDGVGAQRAREAGYAASELPALAKTFALHKTATNATDEVALAAVLDPKSPARRLASYGGRFTASPANFREGLRLLESFAPWYQQTVAAALNGNLHNPTLININATIATADAERGVEKLLFEEIAQNESLSLKETEPERIFGMVNNPAMCFVGRGYTMSFANSLAQMPPEKRQLLYAMVDVLDPLPLTAADKKPLNRVSPNTFMFSRALKNFNALEALRTSGQFDRQHILALLVPDVEIPAGANNEQVNDAIEAKLAQYPDIMGTLFLSMGDTGMTFDESAAAIRAGQRLPNAPYISTYNGKLEELDGTATGGRKTMLGDLIRPSMPIFVANNARALEPENANFMFHFPDGSTVVAKRGSMDDDEVRASGVAIADKLATICGDVHQEQLSALYFSLSQSAIGTNVQRAFTAQGISSDEHMAITFTISKNDETGAVTVRYSEPTGFPLKFSWETTIALDGTATSTPMVITEQG